MGMILSQPVEQTGIFIRIQNKKRYLEVADNLHGTPRLTTLFEKSLICSSSSAHSAR